MLLRLYDENLIQYSWDFWIIRSINLVMGSNIWSYPRLHGRTFGSNI